MSESSVPTFAPRVEAAVVKDTGRVGGATLDVDHLSSLHGVHKPRSIHITATHTNFLLYNFLPLYTLSKGLFFRFYKFTALLYIIHFWCHFQFQRKPVVSTHITRLTQFRHDPASHHPPLPTSTSLHCWSEPGSACLQNGTPPFSPLYLHMMRGNACKFFMYKYVYNRREKRYYVCRLRVCIAERIVRVRNVCNCAHAMKGKTVHHVCACVSHGPREMCVLIPMYLNDLHMHVLTSGG